MKTIEKERLFNPKGEFFTRTEGEHQWVDFKVSNYPGNLWIEWENDCKENYNDMRWLKVLCDHLVAKEKTKDVNAIYNEVMQKILSDSQQEVEKEDEKKNEEPLTFRS